METIGGVEAQDVGVGDGVGVRWVDPGQQATFNRVVKAALCLRVFGVTSARGRLNIAVPRQDQRMFARGANPL